MKNRICLSMKPLLMILAITGVLMFMLLLGAHEEMKTDTISVRPVTGAHIAETKTEEKVTKIYTYTDSPIQMISISEGDNEFAYIYFSESADLKELLKHFSFSMSTELTGGNFSYYKFDYPVHDVMLIAGLKAKITTIDGSDCSDLNWKVSYYDEDRKGWVPSAIFDCQKDKFAEVMVPTYENCTVSAVLVAPVDEQEGNFYSPVPFYVEFTDYEDMYLILGSVDAAKQFICDADMEDMLMDKPILMTED